MVSIYRSLQKGGSFRLQVNPKPEALSLSPKRFPFPLLPGVPGFEKL